VKFGGTVDGMLAAKCATEERIELIIQRHGIVVVD